MQKTNSTVFLKIKFAFLIVGEEKYVYGNHN